MLQLNKYLRLLVVLSAESKTSPLEIPGFTGFYAKLINKLLGHPAKSSNFCYFNINYYSVFVFSLWKWC